jgi:hypothetical protein
MGADKRGRELAGHLSSPLDFWRNKNLEKKNVSNMNTSTQTI